MDFLAAKDEKLNSQQIWLTDLNSSLFSEPPVILQNFLASDFDFSIFQAIFPFVLLFFSPTPLFLNNMPPKTSRLVLGKADEVPRKTAKESHLLSPNTKSQAKVDQQEAKKKEKRQATIKLHRTDHPKSNEQGNNGEAEPEQEHDSDSNLIPTPIPMLTLIGTIKPNQMSKTTMGRPSQGKITIPILIAIPIPIPIPMLTLIGTINPNQMSNTTMGRPGRSEGTIPIPMI